MDNCCPQTGGMKKLTSRQQLAHNLTRLMELAGNVSDNELGRKAKIAHSHIGRMKKQTSAATVDMLDKLGSALGVEPWMLLMDLETAKLAQMAKTLWGPGKTDAEVESHLPAAPRAAPLKEVARRSKKSGGGRNEAH